MCLQHYTGQQNQIVMLRGWEGGWGVREVNSQTEALVDGGVGTLAQLLQLVVALGLAERRVELKQTAHPLARRGLRGLSTQRSQAG